MSDLPLRICYFGTYRSAYSRNRNMIASLRLAGIEVIECHSALWHGIDDRVEAASGGWMRPRFFLRLLKVYLHLFWQHRKIQDYDILMVGYPGQLDVFLARFLSWTRRKPLVWDVFMSIYLIALERGLQERSPVTINGLRKIEKLAIHRPDLLIQDTQAYVYWLSATYDLEPGKFRLVPTGADDRNFFPMDADRPPTEEFRVLYYGSYIPNHGVGNIAQAAVALGEEKQIKFTMIGAGPDKKAAQEFVEQARLDTVRFLDWMDPKSLRLEIAKSDLVLGAFGETPQSLMTVQNKIYEAMAMKKTVLTGDSPALRENFEDQVHVYLCQRQSPQAIAQAIRDLKADPARLDRIAQAGYKRYLDEFSLQANGSRLTSYLEILRPSSPATAD